MQGRQKAKEGSYLQNRQGKEDGQPSWRPRWILAQRPIQEAEEHDEAGVRSPARMACLMGLPAVALEWWGMGRSERDPPCEGAGCLEGAPQHPPRRLVCGASEQ